MLKYCVSISGSSFDCEYLITEEEFYFVMEHEIDFKMYIMNLALYALLRYMKKNESDKFALSIFEDWVLYCFNYDYQLRVYAEN